MEEGKRKNKTWLNILLFVVTVFSAFFVGISWSLSFTYAEELSQNPDISLLPTIVLDSRIIALSLLYAAVLMAILLGHELGHYLTCRYYRIEATLPYFIPAPTLVGTLGAFIKIKSPITRKKHLFDIGVAGPLTGFLLSLPALVYGLSHSKVVPALPLSKDTLVFGEPLILKIIGSILFKDVPSDFDLFLHPVGFAGWVGILVTAFNLFPVGQLDGGHVSYALIGSKAKQLARLFLIMFFVMGILFWVGWIIWALLILILGLKHPRIVDEEDRLSPARKILGFIVISVFILSFIPAPIRGYSLLDLIRPFGL